MYSSPSKKPLNRLLLPLLVGAIVYLLVLMAFDTIHRVLYDFFNKELLVSIGLSYLVLEGNRLVVLLAKRKFRHNKNFIGWSILVVVIASGLTFILCSGGLILYFWQVEKMSNISNFATEIKVFNGIFLFVALFYNAYYLGFTWLFQQFNYKVASEEEENQILKIKINNFHYMMNPDFLLEGMENILLRLREKQPVKADEGILLLSGIYQYFLSRQEELVPLKEELKTVELLEAFISNFSQQDIKLQLSIQDAGCLIVPGTLVRLIEAVGSSQITSCQAPLEILITQERKNLSLIFSPNFSLIRSHKLYQVLEQVKQQHLWLGDRFLWKEKGSFLISIPTMRISHTEVGTYIDKENINIQAMGSIRG